MKLPIGIQTFKKITEKDYIYVDKTKEALNIINNYTYKEFKNYWFSSGTPTCLIKLNVSNFEWKII